jgi:hypothetical protein
MIQDKYLDSVFQSLSGEHKSKKSTETFDYNKLISRYKENLALMSPRSSNDRKTYSLDVQLLFPNSCKFSC